MPPGIGLHRPADHQAVVTGGRQITKKRYLYVNKSYFMKNRKHNPVGENSTEEHPDGGNKLPTIGNPSILPIHPDGGNKLPTIGNPSILPIAPEPGND